MWSGWRCEEDGCGGWMCGGMGVERVGMGGGVREEGGNVLGFVCWCCFVDYVDKDDDRLEDEDDEFLVVEDEVLLCMQRMKRKRCGLSLTDLRCGGHWWALVAVCCLWWLWGWGWGWEMENVMEVLEGDGEEGKGRGHVGSTGGGLGLELGSVGGRGHERHGLGEIVLRDRSPLVGVVGSRGRNDRVEGEEVVEIDREENAVIRRSEEGGRPGKVDAQDGTPTRTPFHQGTAPPFSVRSQDNNRGSGIQIGHVVGREWGRGHRNRREGGQREPGLENGIGRNCRLDQLVQRRERGWERGVEVEVDQEGRRGGEGVKVRPDGRQDVFPQRVPCDHEKCEWTR